MSDVVEYKCPACGGAIEFDSKVQKMKCPYCDTEMSVREFQKIRDEIRKDSASNKTSGEENASDGGQWAEGETDGMCVYACESCGGEIIAEESTGASTCPFCGNRIVMKEQFSGDLKPNFIIPFKKDKKEAKEAYFKHLEGKFFLPKMFRDENHIDEIKGIYVPFWLYGAKVQMRATYNAQKKRVWKTDDTEYTERQYYNVQREGKIWFEHIPADASRKMDDALMDSIGPFDFTEAELFDPAYLAGYMADRYDVDREVRVDRIKRCMKASAENSLAKTVQGYDIVTPGVSDICVSDENYLYALYPVWLLNTTWRGKKYTFAMNGQTGKMVGELPGDKKAFWKYVGIRSVIFGAIIYLLMWIIVLL